MAKDSLIPFYSGAIFETDTNIKLDLNKGAPTFYDENITSLSRKYKAHGNFQITKESTPHQIYDAMSEDLYGLDSYKRAIATLLWKIMHGYKPHGALLISGQSGCGKTEMTRVLEKIYPCIYVANGASFIHSGYTGYNNINAAVQILHEKHKLASDYRPILVIDEFDKMLQNDLATIHGGRDLSSLPELYAIIEGTTVLCKDKNKSFDETVSAAVDTSDYIFILAGSFSGFAERNNRSIGFTSDSSEHDFHAKVVSKNKIKDVLPPELLGRIEDIVMVDELSEKDLLHILSDKRYSPLVRIGNEYGIKITASKAYKERIAKEAYDDGTGVRGLTSAVMQELNNELFETPDIKKLHIK